VLHQHLRLNMVAQKFQGLLSIHHVHPKSLHLVSTRRWDLLRLKYLPPGQHPLRL